MSGCTKGPQLAGNSQLGTRDSGLGTRYSGLLYFLNRLSNAARASEGFALIGVVVSFSVVTRIA